MLPTALLSKKNLTSRLAIRHFQRLTVRLSLGLVVVTSPQTKIRLRDPSQDTLRRLGSAAYALTSF
jgi:predicted metalloprotease